MRGRLLAGLFWQAMRTAPLALGADLALALVQGALSGAGVAALGHLVDRRDGAALLLWGATLVLGGIAGQLRPLVTRHAQQRVRLTLGGAFLDAATRLPYEDFLERKALMRLERAGEALQGDRTYRALGTALNLLTEVSRVFGVAAVLVGLSPWLALPTAAAIAVQFWADAVQIRQRFALDQAGQAHARFADYLWGLFQNPELNAELRVFGAARWVIARWRRVREGLWLAERRLARRALGQDATARGTTLVAYLVALGYGVRLAASGHLAGGVGAVVALAAGVHAIQAAAEEISYQLSDAQDHSLHLLDATSVLARAAGRPPEPPALGAGERIVVRDICYRYPGARREALSGVTFEWRRDRLLALVGENGSGKTTLARVLLGLLPPASGTVAGDGGRPLRPSAVFQDFGRYALTLRENVGLGDIRRMDIREEVEAALAAAVPRGGTLGEVALDTVLTTGFAGGRELSGGQWQAVALGRGLFARGDLIVLDEPTAALDPLAEREVFTRFAALARGRFAVIVTHRMAAAALARDIAVLDHGRLVEWGGHEALVAAAGRYARLWEAQARWYL